MKYRAFISYRRQDASAAARWLREKLLGFRPPKELLDRVTPEQRVDLERRVAYFLDTAFQVANEDFWTANIEPALKDSEYLIVISSPSALLTRPDGSDNWVAREIDTFVKIRGEEEGRRRIIIVLAAGAPEDRYPGRLNELVDRPDWADLRAVSRFAWLRAGAAERLGDALLKIVARIYQVPQELLPILRQEEARKRGRLRMTIGALAVLVVVTLGAALGWALIERDRTEAARQETLRQRDQARQSQARLIAQLATTTLQRGDFAAALALALEALPRDGADRERPYVVEAERALREVLMAPTREVRVVDTGSSGVLDVAEGGIAVLQDTQNLPGGETSTLRVLDIPGARTLGVLPEHRGRVEAVVISDDGRLLLSGSSDGTAHLWDVASNSRISVFPTNTPGRMHLALSRDGKRAMTASSDGTVRLWTAGRNEPRIVAVCAETRGPPRIAYAPDGRHIAVACQTQVRLWSVDRDREIDLSPQPSRPDWSEPPLLAFAGDRLFAATLDFANRANGPVVWHVETGAFERVLEVPGYTETLEASKDGTRILATFAEQPVALLWTVGTSQPVVLQHDGPVSGARLLADGKRLVTFTADGVGRLWDISGRQLALWRGSAAGANFIALSRDDAIVVASAYGSRAVHAWALVNRDVIVLPRSQTARVAPIAMAVSADRSRIAAAFRDGYVHVWRDDDATLVTTIDTGAGTAVTSLAFSPTDATRLLITRQTFDAALWNAENGQRIVVLSDPQGREPSRIAAFAGNGTTIAAGDKDAAMLFDGQSGTHLKTLPLAADLELASIEHLSLSRDGRRLLAAGRSKVFRHTVGEIWSGADLADIVRLQQRGYWNSAVVAPDGNSILATIPGERGIGDFRDDEVRLLGPHGDGGELVGRHSVAKAVFAPDGRTVLSVGGGLARVWSSAQLLAEFPAGYVLREDATFSPDGTRILALSPDRRARLWDIASRTLVAALPVDGGVTRVQFSASGLVTASDDGAVRLWRYPPTTQALVANGCSLLTRPLSREQRKQFFLEEDPKAPPCGWHPDMKAKPAYVPKAAR